MSKFSIVKPSKGDALPPKVEIDVVKLPSPAVSRAQELSWPELLALVETHTQTWAMGSVVFGAPIPAPLQGESWLRDIKGKPSLYRQGNP